MNNKDLYPLLDSIPRDRLPEVKSYLERVNSSYRMDAFLDAAPYDDEELSVASRDALRAAQEDSRSGELYSREDIIEEFGLK